MSNFILLKRIGYGSIYNNIYIDYTNNIIKKECFNNEGIKKITNEIKILKYIKENKINFSTPKIYNFDNNSYDMEYLRDYIPLYKIFKTFDNEKKKKLLVDINNELNNLHNFEKIYISKEIFLKNVQIEIFYKIIDRYNIVKPYLDKYSSIKTINNKSFFSFDDLLFNVNELINNFINEKKEYYFVPIHGDCQFNNVMYNDKNNKICFIDPRGYFGDLEIFGIEEYDEAKIIFALSGYDEFDNREIKELDIQDNNINIFLDIQDENIFNLKNLSVLLMISIWMGNSSCFIKNINKMAYSYFISLYLGTMILKNFKNY